MRWRRRVEQRLEELASEIARYPARRVIHEVTKVTSYDDVPDEVHEYCIDEGKADEAIQRVYERTTGRITDWRAETEEPWYSLAAMPGLGADQIRWPARIAPLPTRPRTETVKVSGGRL